MITRNVLRVSSPVRQPDCECTDVDDPAVKAMTAHSVLPKAARDAAAALQVKARAFRAAYAVRQNVQNAAANADKDDPAIAAMLAHSGVIGLFQARAGKR